MDRKELLKGKQTRFISLRLSFRQVCTDSAVTIKLLFCREEEEEIQEESKDANILC